MAQSSLIGSVLSTTTSNTTTDAGARLRMLAEGHLLASLWGTWTARLQQVLLTDMTPSQIFKTKVMNNDLQIALHLVKPVDFHSHLMEQLTLAVSREAMASHGAQLS